MSKKTQVLFKIISWAIVVLGVSSCVPEEKPTTQASCPTGFAFDAVSRSCLAAGRSPVATLNSVSIDENSGNNAVTLPYVDGNGDQASSCQVTNDNPSKMRASSPRQFDLADDSLTLLSRVSDAYGIPPMPSATVTTAFNTAVSAVNSIRRATSLSVTLSNRDQLIQAARVVAQAAIDYGGGVSIITGETLMAETDDYETYFSRLSDRCHCSAGVCETVLVPTLDESGSAGFSYRVTDSTDGAGPSKNVSVTIDPETKKPLPIHGDVTILESETSTPAERSFAAPSAVTYTSGAAPTFVSYSSASNGSLNDSDCLSPLQTCTYTPSDGDMSDEYISANNPRGTSQPGEYASLSLEGLDFTAEFKGEVGNNMRVRFSEYGGIGHPPEGTVRVLSDAQGPIIDVVVISNDTQASVVRTAINNPANDSSLFLNASIPGSDDPVSAVGATALSGGEDAQDVFTYEVCEGPICSDYDGVFTIHIEEVDDPPVVDVAASFADSDPILEDVAFDLTIVYTDVDSTIEADSCSVTPDNDPTAVTVETPCSCVGVEPIVCQVELQGVDDFFGETFVTVTVDNDDETSEGADIPLELEAVNDAPVLRENNDSGPEHTFADAAILENDGENIGSDETYDTGDIADFFVDRGDLTTQDLESAQDVELEIEIRYTDLSAQDDGDEVIPQTSEFIKVYSSGEEIEYTDTDAANPVVVPLPSGLGALRFTLTAAAFKDTGTTNDLRVDVRLRDDGGDDNGGEFLAEYNFELEVTDVDFPPTIAQKNGEGVQNVETNEGGYVYSLPFIVTEGGLSVEPDQEMVVKVESDNTDLLPNANIEIFYDENDNDLPDADAGGTERKGNAGSVFEDLDDGTDPSADHSLMLKLKPKAGSSGTSNVTITVRDEGGAEDSLTFALIVHPVSAIHGGWSEIKAVSNKVYDRGQLDPNSVCEPSADKCSGGGACEGTVAPHSTVVADEAHAIFYDSGNERCYYAAAAGASNWKELNTFCPVTTSEDNEDCEGASCLDSNSPTAEGVVPSEIDQYFFDYDAKTCYRSTATDDQNDWEEYFPSAVTLGWNSFVLSGSGADSDAALSGWNVYRREHGVPFDFTKPLNEDPLPALTRTYTDETANFQHVYYYLVRPIDSKNSLPTATDDIFSEVRVPTPPKSMALVHRWMANLEICEKMGRTLSSSVKVDPSKSFRCLYNGPGARVDDDDNLHYYDIQRDLFVDRVEVGCPFSRGDDAVATCGSNGCIGLGDPNANGINVSIDGLVYYDRSNASCYVSNGVDNWEEAEDTTPLFLDGDGSELVENGTSALLPPLVNIKQFTASNFCQARSDVSTIDGISGTMSFELPSRRDQIAYSAAPIDVADNAFANIERGLSLNSTSKCNSSRASGLESGYTNGPMPQTSFYYSLPGTSNSDIRSMTTGSVPIGASLSTQACESRYGLQDVYGNVAEWVIERMRCNSNQCGSVLDDDEEFVPPPADPPNPLEKLINPAYDDNMKVVTSNYGFNDYGFDGVLGPCRDIDADGTCDAPLTEWEIQDKNHGASFFLLPMGLPLTGSYVFNNPPLSLSDPPAPNQTERLSNTALEIGPSSGITNDQLKNDAFILNIAAISDIDDNPDFIGSMVTGGGYKSEQAAGRYTFELVPKNTIEAKPAEGGTLVSYDDPATTLTFEAVNPGADGNAISVGLITSGSAPVTPGADDNDLVVTVSGSNITVEIDSGDQTEARDIIASIQASTQASNLVTVALSDFGDSNDRFDTDQTEQFLSGGIDKVSSRRDDIGFRCQVPLTEDLFDADAEHPYDYSSNYQ